MTLTSVCRWFCDANATLQVAVAPGGQSAAAVPTVELFAVAEVADALLHRPGRDLEPGGDLLVAVTVRDVREHLGLQRFHFVMLFEPSVVVGFVQGAPPPCELPGAGVARRRRSTAAVAQQCRWYTPVAGA